MFIDTNLMSKMFDNIDQLLRQQGISLLIETANQFPNYAEEVTGNLFRLCVAIQNLRSVKQQNEVIYFLHDDVLQSILKGLSKADSIEQNIISKLYTIKQIINRSPIWFSDKQTALISRKFRDFAESRKNLVNQKKKDMKMNKLLEQDRARMPFEPQISSYPNYPSQGNTNKK
jgi:hypothetical protein